MDQTLEADSCNSYTCYQYNCFELNRLNAALLSIINALLLQAYIWFML